MHISAAAALAALVLLVAPTTAHTWVEEMDVIDPKTGSFAGTPGYCRNNTKRTVPGFSDPLMVHILPAANQPAIEERDTIPALDTTGVTPQDPMCKHSQQTQYQTGDSPRLQAAPGDLVALRYQENGHVTLPQNQPGKPANRGLVYIYGTTQPKSPELFLDVFGQWNADGTGGDRRGKLLETQPFDDGYCYQVNGGNISTERQAQHPHTPNELMGANLWCQNNIALPTDAATGKPYTLYWVWDWPTEAGVDPNLPKGKAELYTTCMDVDIVAKKGNKRRVKARQAPPSPSSAPGDLNNAAIPAYVSSLTASPAPAGASPAASAHASSAAPEPKVTPSASVQAAAQGPDSNFMTNAGVVSYINSAVSQAVAAQIPKGSQTVIVTAGAPASTPHASHYTPTQALAPAVSSMPPQAMSINPPVLSASPSPPGFSGTATPVDASPAVAAGAAKSSSIPVIVSGAATNSTSSGTSQNGAKGPRGCTAKTCKSKRQSRIFGNKGGN